MKGQKNIFLTVKLYEIIKYNVVVFLCFPVFFYAQKDSLNVNHVEIEEVFINHKDPISDKYSVKKISKIDIYLNPSSNGDPLKAISILPSSTNTEETVNTSLRGSSSDRSRVYFNGAPINNPIRFGRDDGTGSFSIFNAEIVNKQYVYASNPPLVYGNTSAGLIEIETNKELNNENKYFTLALSNIGGMINKKILANSFLQVYGNYQYDSPFLFLNKSKLPDVNSFHTIDFGANTHIKIKKELSINSFNYFINEGYSTINKYNNFESDAVVSSTRFFSVNNIDYLFKNFKIRYVTMFDNIFSKYKFGITNSRRKEYKNFNSIGIKQKINNKWKVQYGIEALVYHNDYDEIIPLYYYANSHRSPFIKEKKYIDFFYIEPYVYIDYTPIYNLNISSAFRKNIFLAKGTESFTSYQISVNHRIRDNYNTIISAGKYHSYAEPNNYIRNYTVLSSDQIAIDSYFKIMKYDMSVAFYYKKEKGERLNFYDQNNKTEIKTFGIENSLNIPIAKNIVFNLSNTFLNQRQYLSEQKYKTSLNLKYFIKSQIIYNNPKILSVSLLFTTRPGNNYTSINGSAYNYAANEYEPHYESWFTSNYSDYYRLDFSVTKIIPMKNSSLVIFGSMNNVFDKENQSYAYYNTDYNNKYFNFYQRRLLYFGMQWRF